jgi:tyrosyl-tRNA synthetase
VLTREIQKLIARFHSKVDAESAHQDFIQRFQKNAIPDEMSEFEFSLPIEGLMIANILKDTKLVNSTSDAMRMIKQGAVKIDGEKVDNIKHQFDRPLLAVLQVGKRKFARINFK